MVMCNLFLHSCITESMFFIPEIRSSKVSVARTREGGGEADPASKKRRYDGSCSRVQMRTTASHEHQPLEVTYSEEGGSGVFSD